MVVGELPLDEPHGQGDLAFACEAVISLEGEFNLGRIVLIEQPFELREAFSWYNYPALEAFQVARNLAVDHREAVAIRGHHSELAQIFLDFEIDAVEVVPGLVHRSGVHRSLDHSRQELGRKAHGLFG